MTEGSVGGPRGRAACSRRSVDAATGRVPAVLMYHSVSPCTEDPYRITVSPGRFARQMLWLRRHGLRGVAMSELLAAIGKGDGRNLVGLTFDDGYADFAEYAVGILAGHGFTATVFVLAGRLGGENVWDTAGPRKPLLSEPGVRQLARAGFEIGSHGWHHLSLREAPVETVAAEISDSRAVLQSVSGQSVTGFCYPYGHVSAESITRVREAGYEYGCAIWPFAETGRYALPRIYIGEADSSPRLTAKAVRHWLTWGYRGPGAAVLADKFLRFA
jgi:peptidoglycan/xylan/chitin deacetylase (PgdA/CDA1 family)